jgi:hypothetical protein
LDILLLLLRILLAALLYAFLGTLVMFLWRDLRRAASGQVIPPPAGHLVVVEGSEAGPAPETTFPLQEVTSLGRTSANSIVLPDPFVSSHHALLAWREGRWWLEDQGSRNGTTLNGEPVTRPTVVSAGDLIGLGKVVMRLEGKSASGQVCK